MRSVPVLVALAAALLAPVHALAAQAPADSVMPRAGSWGAEAMYGGTPAGALLYFSSPSAAWLVGASFSLSHESTDDVISTPTTPIVTSDTRDVLFVDARLGRRWFHGDARSRFQPFRGVGLAGRYANYTFQKSYAAGVYGELGADYFFTPHLSLGASGTLVGSYGEDRSLDRVTTRWTVEGNLVRIAAAVYF